MVVNATGHLRQHPNEAGGGFEVALLRRRLVEMWLLMEFSSEVSLETCRYFHYLAFIVQAMSGVVFWSVSCMLFIST